jgi:osmotically inducible protein OsmC
MALQRKGSAQWKGGLKDGKGTVSTASGVLKGTPYSFSSRFEGQQGTNPEELIGAAHAGCFSMALSAQLDGAGLKADTIDTTATVSLEKLEAGFAITSVNLEVRAKIPGADQAKFDELTKKAKEGCPVSKLLKANITMDAKLV